MTETATATVTPDPATAGLVGSAVAKKFPGFGKDLWEGEVIEGPDPRGRFSVYWARDDSNTWHARSVLEKILTRRGPAATPPLQQMPPLPPPTPTEASRLLPKAEAPSKPRDRKESLEAIESRFLGEDAAELSPAEQRELEACRERLGAADDEAERLRRALAETKREFHATAPAPEPAAAARKPRKQPRAQKTFEVGATVDAAAAAFGQAYAEQARHGGPKVFRGTVVSATVADDQWNVRYDEDGEVYATEARHLTLVAGPRPKKKKTVTRKESEVCVVCGRPTVNEDGKPQDDVILCADDDTHECHLACSGLTPGAAGSMHWRCQTCAEAKGGALAQAEGDLVSPWVGLEAHRLVRERVAGLRREYTQLLVSGQMIDEKVIDVTLSQADACELYGKAVFWEGASADLTAPGGLLYSQLEVGEAEDWRRKPRSISLFPSGRVLKTVEYLEELLGRIQKAVRAFYQDRSPPIEVERAATIMVERWLETCVQAATQVDACRQRVTEELGGSARDDDTWGVRLAYTADTASDHGAAMRGGAGASLGRGDVLVALDAGPFRVAEVYCAKVGAIRLPIRADMLERLLKRFRRRQHESRELLGQREAKAVVVTVEADEPLIQKAGRIPKKRKRPQTNEAESARPPHFLSHMYSMLLRYDDLSGEAGQHGAVPPPVFDVLRKWGCSHECCATPFNATLDSYCSPFLDTDGVFGSAGSFFAFEPSEGCFEINPPFTLSGNHVSDHMGRLLRRAEEAQKPLTFVMIHAAAHSRMAHASCARFVREEIRLEGGSHYYLEGNIYRRAEPRAYVPPFPSVVLFFSTTEGARRWKIGPCLVSDLRRAFAWPREAAPRPLPPRPSAMLPAASRPAIQAPAWPDPTEPPPPPPARPTAIDPADDELAPGWQTVSM